MFILKWETIEKLEHLKICIANLHNSMSESEKMDCLIAIERSVRSFEQSLRKLQNTVDFYF